MHAACRQFAPPLWAVVMGRGGRELVCVADVVRMYSERGRRIRVVPIRVRRARRGEDQSGVALARPACANSGERGEK